MPWWGWALVAVAGCALGLELLGVVVLGLEVAYLRLCWYLLRAGGR